jgi:hypothetical protein
LKIENELRSRNAGSGGNGRCDFILRQPIFNIQLPSVIAKA